MTFVHELRDFIKWVDDEAHHLSKEDALDGARTRALSLLHAFVAYPQCDNFSLMQEST